MKLTKNVIEVLEQSDGKALATYGPDCLHVVPVSTLRIEDDKIYLVNYFMNQTLANIKHNPQVSLAGWRKLEGYQIKAEVSYETAGDIFDSIVDWIATILPDRIVRGVLILDPYEVYDVSATADRPGTKIL